MSLGIISEKPDEKTYRKLTKFWFLAQKWPIYPNMGIIEFLLSNPKQSLLPGYKCLLGVTISQKSNKQIYRKV